MGWFDRVKSAVGFAPTGSTMRLEDDRLVFTSEALRAAPEDEITLALSKVIDDVREGRRPLPKTLAELEGRAGSGGSRVTS